MANTKPRFVIAADYIPNRRFHVRMLAAILDVVVIENSFLDVRGSTAFNDRRCGHRFIFVPPIDGDNGYTAALHELGHFATKPSKRRITRELRAWKWARAVAMWPISESLVEMGLKSHYEAEQQERNALVPSFQCPNTNTLPNQQTRARKPIKSNARADSRSSSRANIATTRGTGSQSTARKVTKT